MNNLVPDTDHISRFCRSSSVINGRVTGAAFSLKLKDEGYLYVNWIEFLKLPDRSSQIDEIRKILKKKLHFGKDSRIAVLNVGKMKEHVSKESFDNRKIWVEHKQQRNDPSYSGIHGLDIANRLISELIAQVIEKSYSATIVNP
ncbi:MAG: hypothetical protein IIA62_04705 [Nitrospinae bacterium]|nr:hypothetical protein [Nitrospinota bacterium]